MSDPTRFNPLEWLFSACLTVLLGALALVAAVHLIQAIWIWLAGASLIGALAALVAVWWRRRQPW